MNCDMFLLIWHLFQDLTCYLTRDLFLHEVCSSCSSTVAEYVGLECSWTRLSVSPEYIADLGTDNLGGNLDEQQCSSSSFSTASICLLSSPH